MYKWPPPFELIERARKEGVSSLAKEIGATRQAVYQKIRRCAAILGSPGGTVPGIGRRPRPSTKGTTMGNWNITIRGVGSHHNKKHPQDANRMAAKFVQELKDAGHHVSSASITFGGEDDISGGAEYAEKRDELEK